MTFCSGTCTRFKAKKPAERDVSRYEAGQKYCSYCEIFMNVDGIRCPCCNKQMKTRSSNKVLREAVVNRI